jgi:hypothetical protein
LDRASSPGARWGQFVVSAIRFGLLCQKYESCGNTADWGSTEHQSETRNRFHTDFLEWFCDDCGDHFWPDFAMSC